MKISGKFRSEWASQLITWYFLNRRDLPWRNQTDPYIIWLSEVILQQTRVSQAIPYFFKFTEKYPTINHLAEATLEDIMLSWQGFGYYSRARNLYQTALEIVKNHNGQFPNTFQELKKLKGIGNYTAAAIASFAYNEPVAVLDGNVMRVLSRIVGFTNDLRKNKNIKYLQNTANQLIDNSNPATYNQAIMEFGSLHCTPKNPDCRQCFFAHQCTAYSKNLVSSIPFKSKKKPIKVRFFNYLVITNSRGKIFMKKREYKDIWQGLFDFELLESNCLVSEEQAIQFLADKTSVSTDYITLKETFGNYVQILSHQKIVAKFFVFVINTESDDFLHTLKCVPLLREHLHRVPKPLIVQKFINHLISL